MVTRSTPALVEPSVIKWARESAGYSLEEAARKLQTTPEKLASWEVGEPTPSISKVRSMASVYKRPLHYLFMDAPPPEQPVPHDFRRSDGHTLRYEPALRFQVRAAYERRQNALDLAESIDESLKPFTLRTSLQSDPEIVGKQVRKYLGINLVEQKRNRKSGDNYRYWRSRVENAGVLVFQVANIATKQMLGFSLSFRLLPVIGINRKLKHNGRVFTLLHEFTHLMLEESGICDLSEEKLRSPFEQRMEVFANAVAAASLLPRDEFLAEAIVQNRGPGRHDWSDGELTQLGGLYGVSEETTLRRLLTLGRTSSAYYRRKRAEFVARYAWIEAQEREAASEQEFRRNRPQEVISDFGRFYSRLVLNNYFQDRITLTDASDFLGVKAPQVGKVEKLLMERS